MSDDVIVSIGASTAGFDAGIAHTQRAVAELTDKTVTETRKATRAMDGLGKATANVAQPAAKAVDKMALLRAESEKLEKAASLLGPRLGGVVSTLSKLGKAGGADIGGATAAIIGLGAAFGATSAAALGFGSIVVNTIGNIDDMADSLDDLTRASLAENIASVQEARDSVDRLGQSWTGLEIVLTDSVDGPLSDTAIVVSAILEGWTKIANLSVDADSWWMRLIPGGKDLSDLHRLAELIDGVTDARQRAYDLAKQQQATMQTGTDALGLTFDFAASATQPAAKPATTTRTRNTSSNRPAATTPQEAILSSMELPGITIPKSQIDLRAAGLDALAKLDAEYAAKKADADKKAADEAIAQIEREQAARRNAVVQGIQLAGQLAASVANFAEAKAQAEVDGAQKGSLAYYYAVQDQFNTHQAAALGMAAINIALGFTQELATKGVIGVGTGAVLAAAGAIEVATILAQKPPQALHVGGPMTAPDEYVVRQNEVPAMLTAEGARDRQALADLNAGQSKANRDPVIYLVDESGMSRARQHTKPRPDLGLRLQGIR